MSAARYAIGVDLGTTHSALSWVDLATSDGEDTVQGVMPIPQLTAPGAVDALALLPSFLYLPHADELAPGELALPWSPDAGQIVGTLARSRGATTPARLVSSAKSWLSHAGVDRRAPILPADAPSEVQRVSPFQASTRVLEHIRAAWDHAHPEAPLAEQDVTVTIPASFDPAARELTVEAAREAGYARLTLLEEPQSALYSWIQGSNGAWRKQVRPGDLILVIDIGGGTSDFSLIAVLEREGSLELHRVAVGDHILLGGDNMDLALAHLVARKLAAAGTSLDAWQMRALTHGCRVAKEKLLGGEADAASEPIVVPSRGSKLIGGSIRTELTRDEVSGAILDGFFPQVDASARPVARVRAGLSQLGLPYAQDAAVTRHLAAFLGRQLGAMAELEGHGAGEVRGTFIHPSAVLFNGGVLKSPVLAQRVLATLNGWLASEDAPPARLLAGADLDLAVACGAAVGCVFAAARPSPTTWRWNRPCLRCRAWSRRCRRCASLPSAWKKAPRPSCRPWSSASSWASRCASGSSRRRCAATTTWARCWSPGAPTSSRKSRPSRPACRPRAGRLARWCRCACTPGSPRLARWRSRRCPATAASAGRWSTTCAASGRRPERLCFRIP